MSNSSGSGNIRACFGSNDRAISTCKTERQFRSIFVCPLARHFKAVDAIKIYRDKEIPAGQNKGLLKHLGTECPFNCVDYYKPARSGYLR